MAILSAQRITKAYVIENILENVSFSVEEGDHIGVIGLNGSGKTTLFKLINGDLTPDSGQFIHPKQWTVGYLSQLLKEEDSELSLYHFCLEAFTEIIDMESELRELEEKISAHSDDPDKLAEYMKAYAELQEEFERRNGYAYLSELKGTLIGLGFSEDEFDRPVAELSGGQKARLSLARLLLHKPDLLLLDEPTNHLDIKAITWLERFLREYRGTVMIISHDRYFLDGVVNRIFHIENTRLQVYETNYTGFMKQRKQRFAIMQKQYENQQREIQRQREIIQRFKNYGDSRYIKQAQSRQKLLEKMERVPPPNEGMKAKFSFQPKITSGKEVLTVEELSKSFPHQTLFEDLSFQLFRGQHMGLIGDNGTGKTTLLRILLGDVVPDSGTFELGTNVHMGYYDQEMKDLDFDKTVIDEIWDDNPKLTHYEIRSLLAKFLFIGDDIFQEISELSGGEKGRLSLLKLMLSKANFLLMDEPTNHLDVDSKEVLENALNDYTGTLLVVSHDRYFLNQVCTQILAFEDEELVLYHGNYDYYLQKKAELAMMAEDDEDEIELTKTKKKELRRKEKQSKEEARKRRREMRQLEEKIHELEQELAKYDEKLSDPDIYDDYENAMELNKKRQDIQEKLDACWEKYFEYDDI